jgi:hypothetical protein
MRSISSIRGRTSLLLVTLLLTDSGLLRAQQAKPDQKAMQDRELAAEATFSKYAATLVENDYENAYKFWSIDAQLSTPYGAFASEQRELRSRLGKLQKMQNAVTFMPSAWPGYPLGTIAFVRAKLQYQFDIVMVTYEFHYEGDRWVISRSKRVPLKGSPSGASARVNPTL